MSFIAELKRRNVFKVAAAYVVVAWLALQIVDTLADPLHLPDWVSSVVFVFLMVGFPVAMILAWAYELTPEGVKKAEEVEKDESITHVTGHKINYLIIGLMAIALGYFIWESRFADSGPAGESTREAITEQQAAVDAPAAPASIAVLPFADMSPQKDQEYFSDGLSEELLNVLAHLPQLKVAARTSSFYFKGKDVKISDIAQQLGVAHVLEGSVRKAGNKIRVTAQLIRAADGFHLWSGTYDRQLDDVFVIQDEISRAIVDALQVKMGLKEETDKILKAVIQKTSPEAHNAYLLGRQLLRQRTEKSIQDAIVQFQRALQIDPDYAPAMARQAEAWLLLQDGGQTYGTLSLGEASAKAEPLIEKALAINPESAEAIAVRGFLRWYQVKNEMAMADFEKAISINPNNLEARVWKATMLGDMGLYRESLEANRESYQLDPLAPTVSYNLAMRMLQLQETDGLEEILLSLEKLWSTRAPAIRSFQALQNKDYPARFEYMLKGYQQEPRVGIVHMEAAHRLGLLDTIKGMVDDSRRFSSRVIWLILKGELEQARAVLQERMLKQTGDDHRIEIAYTYAVQEQWQKANELFELVWKEREGNLVPTRDFGQESLLCFALTRKNTGKLDGIEPLIKYVDDKTRQRIEAGADKGWYQDELMAMYLIRGQKDKALDELEDWVASGYVNPHELSEPWFASVRNHPRFIAAKAKMKENQAKHRRVFLEKMCAHNPFADFWQPGEENCKEVQP